MGHGLCLVARREAEKWPTTWGGREIETARFRSGPAVRFLGGPSLGTMIQRLDLSDERVRHHFLDLADGRGKRPGMRTSKSSVGAWASKQGRPCTT